jgi:hypothetical protein
VTGPAALRRAVLAVASVIAMGCDRGDSETAASGAPTDTATRGAGATAATTTGDSVAAKAGPECVSAGAWQTCSVEKRLTDAGFVPQKQSAPAADLFAVQGTEYLLGPARLHVYVFPSAAEREKAIAAIDTLAIARRGTPATWGGPAWLITSNNLVAVLVSDNARLVERVQLALTAGLPSASD